MLNEDLLKARAKKVKVKVNEDSLNLLVQCDLAANDDDDVVNVRPLDQLNESQKHDDEDCEIENNIQPKNDGRKLVKGLGNRPRKIACEVLQRNIFIPNIHV